MKILVDINILDCSNNSKQQKMIANPSQNVPYNVG